MEHKYVYLIRSQGDKFYKIGISKDPEIRLKDLQTGSPKILEIVATQLVEEDFARDIERDLHTRFEILRQGGEWFYIPDKLLPKVIKAIELSRFYREKIDAVPLALGIALRHVKAFSILSLYELVSGVIKYPIDILDFGRGITSYSAATTGLLAEGRPLVMFLDVHSSPPSDMRMIEVPSETEWSKGDEVKKWKHYFAQRYVISRLYWSFDRQQIFTELADQYFPSGLPLNSEGGS